MASTSQPDRLNNSTKDTIKNNLSNKGEVVSGPNLGNVVPIDNRYSQYSTDKNTVNTGQVLGTSTGKIPSTAKKPAPAKKPAASPKPSIAYGSNSISAAALQQLIDQQLNSYIASGKLKGQKGDKGDKGDTLSSASGGSGSATGMVQNNNGQSTAVIGGNPIVSYYPAVPSANFNGTTIAGFGDLSANNFTTQTGLVSGALNVSGNTTLSSALTVSGQSTLATTTISNLTVSGNAVIPNIATTTITSLTVSGPVNLTGSTTIAGLTVSGLNPGLTVGSVAFQNASGLSQDNSNFFYDATNHRLGLGTTTPSQLLTVAGNAYITGNATTSGNSVISGNQSIAGTLNVSAVSTLATTSIANLTISQPLGVSSGGIGTTTLGNLTVSSSNLSISGGQQVLIGTSTQITLTGTPTFSTINGNTLTTGTGTLTLNANTLILQGGNTTLTGANSITSSTISTSTISQITLLGNGYTLNITGNATTSGINSGDVTLAGQNYLSLSGQQITANAIDLSGSNATGILAAGRFPALTGDVTTTVGSLTTVLATVNNNVGSFGDASHVGAFTVNGKGLITAASNVSIALDSSAITSGILGVSRGGTGAGNLTASDILFGNGTSAVATSSNFTFSATSGLTVNATTTFPSGIWQNNGYVGIGTTTIGSRVVIQGSDTTSGNSALNVTDSAGASKLYVRNDGNVGVGTTTPNARLTVTSSGTTNPFTITSSSGVTLISADSLGNFNLATLTASSLVMSDAGKNLASVSLGSGLSLSGNTLNTADAGFWLQNGNALYNGVGYQIGINSSTPIANLSVAGSSTAPTIPIFTVASSSGSQYLTVAANGSTTVSSLNQALPVFSTSAGSLYNSAINLNSGSLAISGTLAYSNGGTGQTSYTTNGVVYAGASALQSTTAGTVYQLLTSNGASSAPTYRDISSLITPGSNLATSGTSTIAVVASPTFTNLTLNGTLSVTGTSTLATTSITSLTVNGNSISGGNSGDVTLAGQNYLTISGQQITANPINLSGGNITSVLNVANGGTGANQLTANDILFGNGTNAVATSSGFTFDGTTLAAPALSITGNINNATLTTSSLVMSDAGKNLASVALGAGLTMSGSTLNVLGAGGGYWSLNGSSLYNNTGYLVGVNSSTPIANLSVVGSSTAPTIPIFTVASSSGSQYLTVAANGSTTFSSLGTGIVRSSAGSLFNGQVSLTSDVSGILPVLNGGTGSSTLGTTLVGFVANDTNVTGSISANNLTLGWQGQLAVSRGGTGANQLTAFDLLVGNGTNAVATVAPGTIFQVLRSAGSSANPTYSDIGTLLTGGTNINITGTSTINLTGVVAVGNGGTGTSTAPTQQGQLLIADSTGTKYAPGTLLNTATLSWSTSTVQQLSANVLKVPNALTFNNGGAGASSGQTFDGSSAATISYNTIGAQAALTNPDTGTGTNGQVAYFTGATSLTSGSKLLFDGSNFGFNATSSTIGFNIQGTGGTNDILNAASSSTTSFFVVKSSGNVGIGTVTPTTTLYVQGSGSTNPFQVSSSTGSGLMVVTSQGNVGIGTTNPGATLQIVGSTYLGATNSENHVNPSQLIFGNYQSAAGGNTNTFPQFVFNGPSSWMGLGQASVSGNSLRLGAVSGPSGTFGAMGATAFNFIVDGNVGIGTTNPGKTLDVNGNTNASNYYIGGSLFADSAKRLQIGSGATTFLSLTVGSGGNAGLYSPAINVLGFATNGNEAMRIDTTGNVGIGTTTVGSRLVIQGSTADNTANAMQINNSSGTGLVTVRNDGNVGIGTTSPTAKLTISQSDDNTGIRVYGSTVPTAYFDLYVNNAGNPRFYSSSNMVFEGAAAMYFRSGSTSYFNDGTPRITDFNNGQVRIQSTGNVGIGTTTVNSRLVIQGSTSDSSAAAETSVNSSGNVLMTVLNNGNVGIGTSAPATTLSIQGSGSTDLLNIASSTGTSVMYISKQGNVGIGTSTPSQMLTVGNNNQFTVSSVGALAAQMAAIGSSITPVVVSGNGLSDASTSPNGIYVYGGQYSGVNYYQLGTSWYMWTNGSNRWYIGPVLGNPGIKAWHYDTSALTPPLNVSWTPFSSYSGNPTTVAGVATTLTVDSGGNILTGGVLSVAGTGNSYILGNVGIGTSTPQDLVAIQGTSGNLINFYNGATSEASLSSSGTFTAKFFSTSFSGNSFGGTSFTGDVKIASSNLMVGTSTAAARLSVTGTSAIDPFDVSSTSGVSLVHVTQAGNVGIGTTSPNALLTIGGSLTTTAVNGLDFGGDVGANLYRSGASGLKTDGSLIVTNDLSSLSSITSTLFRGGRAASSALELRSTGVAGTTDYIALEVGNNGATEAMRIIDNGNVGIGTTSPQAILSVNAKGTVDPFDIYSTTTGSSVMRVTYQGNVGIGTTNPNAVLNVAQSAVGSNVMPLRLSNLSSNAFSGVGMNFDAGGIGLAQIIAQAPGSSNGYLDFVTSNGGALVTRMRIDNQGNVGIGTTTPAGKLDIRGSTADGSTNILTWRDSNNVGLGAILTNGNVGIGTTSPDQKLTVYGNMDVATGSTPTLYVNTATKSVGIGTSTPTLGPLTMASGAYVTTGGTWTNASDRNLKENFATMTPADILQKIDLLPVTEWNYKTEGAGIKHIGPVAQDFYALFNVGNSNTSISTIDPGGVALLGIQALDQKITALQGSLINQATTTNLIVYNPSNFSGDSVGEAKILAGATSVRVTFSQPYQYQPIITLTPAGPYTARYWTDNANSTGFTVVLEHNEDHDVTFDWHAFASPKALLTVSSGTTSPITLAVAAPPPQSNTIIIINNGGGVPSSVTDNSASSTPQVLGAATSTSASGTDSTAGNLGTGTPTSTDASQAGALPTSTPAQLPTPPPTTAPDSSATSATGTGSTQDNIGTQPAPEATAGTAGTPTPNPPTDNSAAATPPTTDPTPPPPPVVTSTP